MDPSYSESGLDVHKKEKTDSRTTVILLFILLVLLTFWMIIVAVYFFYRWKREKSARLNMVDQPISEP
jgi:predicted nucleic acid-binding Zn ribbon protein